MNRKLTALSALSLAAAASGAYAQGVIEVEEITASASLEPVEIVRSGVSVAVLERDDIEALGQTRLSDVLSRVPGVEVRQLGPIGTRTGIQIRGASQNYVSVIVDGIEITDPSATQVSVDFGTLTTTDISRIEILKGSQSAIYGSEAVGGVIVITTNRATEIGTTQRFNVEAGSYDTYRATYGLAQKTERAELAFSLSHVRTDGFSAADEDDGNTEADGFEATRLSFSGKYELEGGTVIGFSGFAEENEGDFDEFGGAGGDGTPGDEFNDNRLYGLRTFAEFTTGAVDHVIDLTWADFHRESFFNGSPSVFDGRRLKLGYLGATDVTSDLRLAFGAEATREDGSDNFGFDGDTTVYGVFSEATWSPSDRLDVTAALRFDDHSEFGSFTTGRLAAAYRPMDDLTIRGSIGTGYRAPSLYELFSAFGDPDLQPEESLSADVGVEKRHASGAYARATVFHLEVDDLIDFDLGTFTYTQVTGTSERTGLELEGGFPIGDFAFLSAGYTYTDSSSNASSAWASVPRHSVDLTADVAVTDRLKGALGVELAADRQNGLPDYWVADASLTYAVRDDIDAYLRIENLFDEDYQIVPGYGTSGRAFYVGLRGTF